MWPLVWRFFLIFVSLSLVCTSLTASLAAQEPTFRIEEGSYLWHVWNSPATKQKYPDWRDYWRRVAALNGLPATEAVWRSLPVGRVIRILPLTDVVVSDETVARLQEDNSRRAEQISVLEREIEGLESSLAQARESSLLASIVFALFVLTSLLLGIWVVVLRRKVSMLDDRLETLQTAKKREWSAAVEFAASYGIMIQLPQGIKKINGEGSLAYFPIDPRAHKGWVCVLGIPDPIRIENLKRRLDHASPEVLKLNNLVRVSEPIPSMSTES